ncbi:uncharacterized protein [Cicer arietinum]|uniref:Uncharacterized protein LOC101499738 n=1 Tax=Cicer arietinum TaxID=3827 RepID=A0A1S2XHG7_CICAR|nr:uncharacterized protein LOC101499738 [Cicer arietinum]XP_004488118.1 uncharacterized protein LOC101499738 [Cicer arietinum]XP_004488119.1 uncharacterized protein LOC101499738 [Cicer arietinum]XP_027188895.1 uncharacterized protein LOC101499738 [Cicer arietinum]XP_027188901.1 uncharacterized protein LOC101499738 [Cicer arietinum]XP_027188902.1 uncharacterized protein LOC101499738 [Cicer arietinum]
MVARNRVVAIMGTMSEVVEIESLEKSLLEENEETVLYAASFQEMEKNFVKYQTVQWVLYSLLLILAWGIGLLMLLYIPIRRFILTKDIRSRTLYLTPNAIVYKVTRPVPFPCFGVLHKEKHVLLHSVADVVVEQGYLQSLFGVYSLRIENVGVRRPPSDDVKILGIANPNAFKKAVMMRLSNMRNDIVSRQVSTLEDVSHLMMSPSKSLTYDSTHFGELLLLQKLDEVGSSVKRIQTLFEEQQSQKTESID